MIAVAVLMPVTASSQELGPRSFFDGRITMLIPTGFEPMSEEMLSAKYIRQRRPTLVLTNPDGSVNIALNYTAQPVMADQIPEIHRAVEQGIRRQFPTGQWNGSDTSRRDGNRYFKLDFVSPAIDTDIRNIMFGTSLGSRLLLISFNCTRGMEAKWAPLGHRIIDSISVVQR